jgi:hypothetical protein
MLGRWVKSPKAVRWALVAPLLLGGLVLIAFSADNVVSRWQSYRHSAVPVTAQPERWELTANEYVVMVPCRTKGLIPDTTDSKFVCPHLAANGVRVLAKGGSPVSTTRDASTDGFPSSSATRYHGAVTFRIQDPGTYTISLVGPSSSPAILVEAPGSYWRSLGGWIGVAIGGLILEVALITAIVVVANRKSRNPRPPGPPTSSPIWAASGTR